MFLYLDVKVFVHVIEILLQYGCNFSNIFFMSSDLQNNYSKMFYTFFFIRDNLFSTQPECS